MTSRSRSSTAAVCHTDLHLSRDDWKEWGPANYPCVPGHEIVGRVIATGSDAKRHAVGDVVAVGTMIDSCQHCDQCHRNEEQMCRNGVTITYNAVDRIDGSPTYGGFSKHIVVREEFALRVPDGLDASRAAPLLCAGITVYSPLRQWNVGARQPRRRRRHWWPRPPGGALRRGTRGHCHG